jgi:hypothetical protein
VRRRTQCAWALVRSRGGESDRTELRSRACGWIKTGPRHRRPTGRVGRCGLRRSATLGHPKYPGSRPLSSRTVRRFDPSSQREPSDAQRSRVGARLGLSGHELLPSWKYRGVTALDREARRMGAIGRSSPILGRR